MAKRPTIKDVARAAGLSVATVNRVIAGSGNVREETGRAVAQAAHQIGYHAVGLIEQRLLPNLPRAKFGFLLQKEKQEFYQNLTRELTQAAADFKDANCDIAIEYCHSQAPADVAEQLMLMGQRVQVLGAVAINHPKVTAAVVELKEKGVETFALLTDYAQGERLGYIGLNNLKVGRGAASMLSIAAPKSGKIAIFVGGHRWHGHELREAGFRAFFREQPAFQVLDTLVNLETRQLTREATLDLLERHPDIVGLYVAGGGMEGAIAALREVRAPGDVALVVNELTQDSKMALIDGYVTLINETPLSQLSQNLIAMMFEATKNSETVPSQKFLTSVLHLPEFD
ncbi:MAG: substrate-binding domain-containing protein [Silicimonas sp.]|nr:substrate-binding domain-containing protein [Silicimonas sp.]